jgi:hypothetical protein
LFDEFWSRSFRPRSIFYASFIISRRTRSRETPSAGHSGMAAFTCLRSFVDKYGQLKLPGVAVFSTRARGSDVLVDLSMDVQTPELSPSSLD